MAKQLHRIHPDEKVILSKALANAADYWELTNKQLGEIIGCSEPTVSRLKKGQYLLDPQKKEWQVAAIFLRIFRGLDAYMGGNAANEKRWLKANNSALGGAPIELMCHIEGLASVVQYVDYMRGQ